MFRDALSFNDFKDKYQICLWEMKHQTPWGKLAAADQQYAEKTWNGYAEVDMLDGEDYPLTESEEESAESTEESQEEEESEEDEDEDDNIL